MKLPLVITFIFGIGIFVTAQQPCRSYTCDVALAKKAAAEKKYNEALKHLSSAGYYSDSQQEPIKKAYKELLFTIEQDKDTADPKSEGAIVAGKIRNVLTKLESGEMKIMALPPPPPPPPPSVYEPNTPKQDSVYFAKELKGKLNLVKRFESQLITNPTDTSLKKALTDVYGSTAWYQILTHDYKGAVASVQRGIEIWPQKSWVNTNLALGYLLTNNWKEAKKIYVEWKDVSWRLSGASGFGPPKYETFKWAFLEDLDELEKYGISHPGFKKARKLLVLGKK